MTQIRQPRKRRTTLANIPHLRAYLMEGSDESPARPVLLRVGLDSLSRYLLAEISKQDDLAEATWFAQLGHRLLKEKKLVTEINAYAAAEYHDLPESPLAATQLFTIPIQLKEMIEKAAASGPFYDKRGVTSPWLRAAICYIAFVEKNLDVTKMPPHLFSAT